MRSTGNPAISFGDEGELLRFDLEFNNSLSGVNYTGADEVERTLASGQGAVWVNGQMLVESYNPSRQAGGQIGDLIHGIGMVADSATIASFDLDNLTVFDGALVGAELIPEPSTYALIFGMAVLGGAFYIRRRRS